LPSASTASVAVSKVRRSIRLVSHAVSGEPIQSTMAPNVTKRPAVWTVIPRSDDSSINMPAGARIDDPVTRFPNISAVGAKRRWTGLSDDGFCMHAHLDPMHVDGKCNEGISWAQSGSHERKSRAA
jgi:hypothetical protein